MKLHAVRLFVYDLQAAHDFYTGKLGLRLQAGGEMAGCLVYDAGGARLVVEAVAPEAGEEVHALVGRFTGLSFTAPDIHAAYTDLRALGVHFTGAPEPQAWGALLATFVDPSENQLQLVQVGTPDHAS